VGEADDPSPNVYKALLPLSIDLSDSEASVFALSLHITQAPSR
jgi:hypothetical protein